MDHDLTIMIYGAIMGVVGSILTSLITTVFQFWLARREYERQQNEERSRQLRHIHLPTDKEVILINSSRDPAERSEGQRETGEARTIGLSVFVGGVLVDQTNDPILSFSFAALRG